MARERILVVEDEEDIQKLVLFNLGKEGYRAAGADSGEAGLESARREPPDLVILDLMLPGIDGLEACRRLRADPADEAPIRAHGLVINPARREVRAGDALVELTATEFSLLLFLARRPGWVFTRSQIIEGVKGGDYPVTDRAVDVQVLGLRRKLGPSGNCVETVRGVGYRFREV